MVVKAKTIWELEDYLGNMPSEDDIIPVIDVNGDADETKDWDGTFDHAVTRKLTFGKVKEQMASMSARYIKRLLKTTFESMSGYYPDGDGSSAEVKSGNRASDGTGEEASEATDLAVLLNAGFEYVNTKVFDLVNYIKDGGASVKASGYFNEDFAEALQKTCADSYEQLNTEMALSLAPALIDRLYPGVDPSDITVDGQTSTITISGVLYSIGEEEDASCELEGREVHFFTYPKKWQSVPLTPEGPSSPEERTELRHLTGISIPSDAGRVINLPQNVYQGCTQQACTIKDSTAGTTFRKIFCLPEHGQPVDITETEYAFHNVFVASMTSPGEFTLNYTYTPTAGEPLVVPQPEHVQVYRFFVPDGGGDPQWQNSDPDSHESYTLADYGKLPDLTHVPALSQDHLYSLTKCVYESDPGSQEHLPYFVQNGSSPKEEGYVVYEQDSSPVLYVFYSAELNGGSWVFKYREFSGGEYAGEAVGVSWVSRDGMYPVPGTTECTELVFENGYGETPESLMVYRWSGAVMGSGNPELDLYSDDYTWENTGGVWDVTVTYHVRSAFDKALGWLALSNEADAAVSDGVFLLNAGVDPEQVFTRREYTYRGTQANVTTADISRRMLKIDPKEFADGVFTFVSQLLRRD